MSDIDDTIEGNDHREAWRLRQSAEDDDRTASEAAERNPSWSEYLSRRATFRRWLANNLDGGMGQ